MPLAVEGLTPESDITAIRDSISKSIEKCMQEGKDQKQCAAIAYSYARDKTGRALDEGKLR